MEKTFSNAAVIFNENSEDETIVISTTDTEVYLGTYTKDTNADDVIEFGLDTFSTDNGNAENNLNKLSVDISNVEEDDTLTFVVLLYSGGYGPDNPNRNVSKDNEAEKPEEITKTASSILIIRFINNGMVMSVPINFTLAHTFPNLSSIEENGKHTDFDCSFIDETKEPIHWSSFGCTTEVATNLRHSNCSCNHTTSFAVLMKVTDNDVEVDTKHETALSWIMYIGCGVSIVALSVALATFTYVGLTDRIKIHVCLCATLLVAESFMLVGLNLTKPPELCTTIAVILHFSFLSVFAWMLVEGIHMYVMIIRVFGSENIDFNYYFIVGWAFPIVVVGVSVGANLDGYGNDTSCWLDVESGLIWAFVGPALLIILINFMVLVLVVRIIKRATNKSDDDIVAAKATIKGIVVLLPILGITWVFGLFAIGSATLMFQYIFSILNSLQGLFIFIFYCLMNSEVRSSFERKRKQNQLNNGDILSTMDISRSGKSSKQSKITALSHSQLQSADDKKDIISVKVEARSPSIPDEGIDMNMPGGIDEPIGD
ncbi:adhesion G-protein coupled receptor D1-like [Antedon mediterranea]|uniref:adhesion G-protein coupled receptor D1-like n=1 Tax=Antedon mediterranea TaxID=105859 RepID=UPI003AF63199